MKTDLFPVYPREFKGWVTICERCRFPEKTATPQYYERDPRGVSDMPQACLQESPPPPGGLSAFARP